MRKRLRFVYGALRLETVAAELGRAVYATSLMDKYDCLNIGGKFSVEIRRSINRLNEEGDSSYLL